MKDFFEEIARSFEMGLPFGYLRRADQNANMMIKDFIRLSPEEQQSIVIMLNALKGGYR